MVHQRPNSEKITMTENRENIWWFGAIVSILNGFLMLFLWGFGLDNRVTEINFLWIIPFRFVLFNLAVLGILIGLLIMPFGINE